MYDSDNNLTFRGCFIQMLIFIPTWFMLILGFVFIAQGDNIEGAILTTLGVLGLIFIFWLTRKKWWRY